MNGDELIILLEQAVDEHSQAEVARVLGYSASAVNQVLHGRYNGDPSALLARVYEVYGGATVACPVLGEIPLSRCAEERKKPFSMASGMRVRLFRACRSCERRLL